MKLKFELAIYPYQIDAMQHVSNIAYIQWMEIGRCMLLDEVDLSVTTMQQQGYGPVLAETQITYRKPLLMGDRVSGAIWISKLSRASVLIEFEFHNQARQLCARGQQKGLFVDLQSGRPKRFTQEMDKQFRHYLIETEG